MEDHFKKQEKEMVDDLCTSFIYQCNQQSFEVLCEGIGQYGRGYIPPSLHRIRKPLLEKHYENVAELKNRYLPHWKQYGVTLMTDGWTDRRGRSLLNFLVNCPKGTFFLNSVEASSEEKNSDYLVAVIEEHMELVGLENIVQICTDNASNYVLAGKKLIEKYPTLFWTPCAAHCLDLLLEDIGKLSNFKKVITTGRKITSYVYTHTRLHDYFLKCSNKKELVRCGVTRFATSFLTLQSLFDMRTVLRTIFISEFWMKSSWRKEEQGIYVSKAVMSVDFWDHLEDCLRASQPILQVLKLVDSDEKSTMGYIIEALTKAKEGIKVNFGGKEKDYKPIIALMVRRLELHFDHMLYGAGAFLNLAFFYACRESGNTQVKIYEAHFQMCVEKMIQDREMRHDIMMQVESYKQKKGRFGSTMAEDGQRTQQPMNWWDHYGVLTPNLQMIALRILGLTTTVSNCERNWSIFEIIQSKRRSNLQPERLSKLVFIKYNKALHERFQTRRLQNKSEDYDPIMVDYLNYSSEWMTGQPGACNEFVYEEDGLTWAEVDEAMGASELNVRPRRTPARPLLLEHGSRIGDHSIPIRTYSRKAKEIVVDEEDCEDEGFRFKDDFENLMNEYSD